jgi:quercetin dioxygenase-like cupin family protein
MAADAGHLCDLDAERPYAGIVRRTIRGSHHTLMIYEFEPGASFPMHLHDEEQTTVVVAGDVEFISDEWATPLCAGDWSVVSPGVPHRIVAGSHGARFIAVVAPPRESYEVLDGT